MAITFGEIKLAIFRRVGDLERTGTATGGSTTTLVDTALTDSTDTSLKGVHVYAYDGTGQSRETRATAFTPASDTITVPSGTAFSSGTKYILSRRFAHSDVLDAMRAVIHARGPYAKGYVDQSLIAGSPLVNATFYDSSGTFPNGWTVSGGTWTQGSTEAKHGRFFAKGVSSGEAAASIYQDIPNVGRYRGQAVYLHGWVHTNTTGSRVNILVDDGIDTTTGIYSVTTANRGWGTAEAVTARLIVSDRASRLRVSCNITDGSAVTANFSGIWLSGVDWRQWVVPAGSPSSIHRWQVERFENDETFGAGVSRGAFDVLEEGTRRIYVKSGLTQGLIMQIEGRTGWADLTAPSTDDDASFDGAIDAVEGLIAAAAAMLLQNKTDGSRPEQVKISNLLSVAASHGFTGAAIAAPTGSLLLVR